MLIFPSNLLRSPRLHLYSHRNPIFLEVRMHFRKQVSQWEEPEQHVTRSPLTPHSPVPGCRAPVHGWRRGAWTKPASRPQLGSPAATPTGLPVCVTQHPHSREDSTVWRWISRICQILRWEGPLTWPLCVFWLGTCGLPTLHLPVSQDLCPINAFLQGTKSQSQRGLFLVMSPLSSVPTAGNIRMRGRAALTSHSGSCVIHTATQTCSQKYLRENVQLLNTEWAKGC